MEKLSGGRGFDLGRVIATPAALAAIEKAGQEAGEFLVRHANCDWGDLGDSDREENQYGIEHGLRLMRSYRTNAGEKVWVITESDRSATTLLLPDEY
jgi:hypothetical protein